MPAGRISARYWIETGGSLEEAAAALASAQSGGTFVRVPGETDELRLRHAARVEELRELEGAEAPSLPGARPPAEPGRKAAYRRGEALISWPLENMGTSLPNVMSAVAGNLFELKPFSGLRLLDLTFPREFLGAYSGPQFGVDGTRRLAGVYGRPLIGTIIKPSVGLSPEETAALVRTLVEAGVDFIKDDELRADGPHCPFERRVDEVLPVLNEHADRTGKKVMYAFNLTGEVDEMLRRQEYVAARGGTCVMVSILSAGLAAVAHLRRHCALPIHAHRNGWGLFSRSPAIGVSFIAYQKIWRLAGVDHLHVNGLASKFCEDDESVIGSARECLTPMFDLPGRGCEVMPVFGSGQSVKQAPGTYQALGSADLIYVCGGGVMAHPDGPAAGVRSLRQAWEAAMSGRPAADYARDHPELRRALERFAG